MKVNVFPGKEKKVWPKKCFIVLSPRFWFKADVEVPDLLTVLIHV